MINHGYYLSPYFFLAKTLHTLTNYKHFVIHCPQETAVKRATMKHILSFFYVLKPSMYHKRLACNGKDVVTYTKQN